MATIKDVARRASVSVATVSYVLNDSGSVSQETRERVLDAIKQLDYHPNAVARSLQSRRSDTVAFVLSARSRRVTDPFFMELVSTMVDESTRRGFNLLLSAAAHPSEESALFRRLAKSGRAAAFLLADTQENDPRLRTLGQLSVPVVTFGRTGSQDGHAWIDVDGRAGVRLAVEHLVDLGHRRIAFLAMTSSFHCAGEREAGYRDGLAAAGLAIEGRLIVSEELTEDGGYRAMSRLPELEAPPTAVVASSDVMAFGAMRAIRECGLEPGIDVSVVGFDDIALAASTHPALTTVRQPIAEIGRELVRLTVSLVRKSGNEGNGGSQRHHLIVPELIVRESTAPPVGKRGA